MISSRQKPLSARTMICALGQRFRTAATIFWSAWTAPRAASPSLVRSFGPERDRADKGIEGQITVAAIEAVNETTFLLAVQRIVTGIQIDDDLLGYAWAESAPPSAKGSPRSPHGGR